MPSRPIADPSPPPPEERGGSPRGGAQRGERPSASESASVRFGALVEGSTEGMVVVDDTGTILYMNPAGARLVERAPEGLRGRAAAELCRPDHVLMAREVFLRSLEKPGEEILSTADAVLPDGRFRTLDFRVINHCATPGIAAVLVYFRESTASAEELVESFRALFEHAAVGLGVADMQGHLLAFNDAMLRPGGHSREDIEALSGVADLYARPADRVRVLQMLRANGFVWRERVPFVRKDGSTHDTLLSLRPIVFQGRACILATVEALDQGAS